MKGFIRKMNSSVLLRGSWKSGSCRSVLLHWQQRWSSSYGTYRTNEDAWRICNY